VRDQLDEKGYDRSKSRACCQYSAWGMSHDAFCTRSWVLGHQICSVLLRPLNSKNSCLKRRVSAKTTTNVVKGAMQGDAEREDCSGPEEVRPQSGDGEVLTVGTYEGLKEREHRIETRERMWPRSFCRIESVWTSMKG
jgi:hypothetical protein